MKAVPSKIWIVFAAIAGASGVALGAYISHGLSFIAPDDVRETARASLQSAVQYQMLHALALLAVGIWAQVAGGARMLAVAGIFFYGGYFTLLRTYLCAPSGGIRCAASVGALGRRVFYPWLGLSGVGGRLRRKALINQPPFSPSFPPARFD